MTALQHLARVIWRRGLWCAVIGLAFSSASRASDRPNVVLIFADDLGYGDVACFGSSRVHTPHLDALAAEGRRFTSFYVAQAVCTASRAALLTGCYANRVGLQGALNHTSPNGISREEELLPELLHDVGYATGIFGKWHLGLPPFFSPLRHGFDEWLGIPYSNDNSKYHPVLASEMPPLPFYDGDSVIEADPDQATFTRRLTERAVDFIGRHRGRAFFLYLPHIMPHVPIFASPEFAGKSGGGLYADVIQELDHSVGEILTALDQNGLAGNTIVVFTSDNGPFLSYGSHAGSAGPFRGGKLTTFEGGVRMPFIVRWPGHIPAGTVCDEPVMSIDLLPTLTGLAGAAQPRLPIDGLDIRTLLLGAPAARTPHEALYFYSGAELQAVRSGRWKLHFAHPYLSVNGPTRDDGKPAGWGSLQPQSITQSGISGIASRHGYRVEQQRQALYDLVTDPGETHDVSADHPDIVSRLSGLAEAMRGDLGDALTDRSAIGARPVGRAE